MKEQTPRLFLKQRKPHRLFKLYLIRHIRHFFLKQKVYEWAWLMNKAGIGTDIPNSMDLDYLDAIWKGEA